MRTVAVFFGGRSNEREISVITGMLAVNLLRGGEYRVLPVYLGEEGGAYLAEEARGVEFFRRENNKKMLPVQIQSGGLVKGRGRKRKIKVDCALNCCHGGMGEDGTLSALLRWAEIPLASPDVAISSVFMNKEYSQIAARGLNIPAVPSFTVSEEEWQTAKSEVEEKAEKFGYPLIVKPSVLGSSIGISVARNGEELSKSLALAFRLDSGVLIEKYLKNKRDLNCAAVRVGEGVRVSQIEEVFSSCEILSFSEKYEETSERTSQLPADVPAEIAARVGEYTRRIYTAFHGEGIVRADFLYADGEVYFNELNTVPGSLALYLFHESLTCGRELLLSLIEQTLSAPREKKEILRTGILEQDVFGGAKGCKTR